MQRGIPAIELYLLGGVELRGVDSSIADRLLAQAKLTALLALLALSPAQRPQRRDRIVGFLWPELGQARARAALRKAVHALRGTLGADAVRSRGDEEICLAMPPVWCDAVELADAADSGKMQRAVELYRGELMPGFYLNGCAEFQRWLDEERTELLSSSKLRVQPEDLFELNLGDEPLLHRQAAEKGLRLSGGRRHI